MNTIEVANSGSRLIIDAANGSLLSAVFGSCPCPVSGGLWRLTENAPNGGRQITPDSMPFSAHIADHRTRLCWQNDDRTVCVDIFPIADRFEMSISVESAKHTITDVVFPIFGNVGPISKDGEDDFLVFPWQTGAVIKNPIKNLLPQEPASFWLGRGDGKSYENDYPAQYSYQFMAYYGSEAGYYFATRDPEAHIKTYGCYLNDDGGMDFAVTNYPRDMGITKSYQSPYRFELRLFKGDWQDAAAYYRAWATRQKWCKKGRLAENVPQPKVYDTELWRINHTTNPRGRETDQYVESSFKLRDAVGAKLALHWYGWNMRPHDVHYPDYLDESNHWPEKLAECVQRFKDGGIEVIPYTNARLWDRFTPSWDSENAQKDAIKGPDGGVIQENWNPGKADLTPMCPSTKAWQDRVKAFDEKYIKRFGFSGLYIDQIGSFNATLCFDPNHSHPAGGGCWWCDSYREMMGGLREKAGDEVIFTTESCCESYLDLFDLFLTLDTTVIPPPCFGGTDAYQSVPLFTMIYGDYALAYGSCINMSSPIEHFRAVLGRNTIWGIIPTVEGFHMDDFEREDIDQYLLHVRKAVEVFRRYKKLFYFGRPMRLLDTQIKAVTVDMCDGWSRETGEFPAVFGMLWEDADKNQFEVYYNHTPEEITLSCGTAVAAFSYAVRENM